MGKAERPEMQFEQDECRKRLALHCKNAQSKLSEKHILEMEQADLAASAEKDFPLIRFLKIR